MWWSVLTDPLQGWLGFLKPSGARRCLWLSSALCLLTAFFFLCFLSLFFYVCVCVPSTGLYMASKPLELMAVRFLFQLCRIACYNFAWNSLSRAIIRFTGSGHLSSYELRQLSLSVRFFSYIVEWVIRHLGCQSGPQILINRGLIPHYIRSYRWAR